MCGIIARVGRSDSVGALVSGLESLEYRGYDSAGVAVKNGTGIKVHKRSGKVAELKSAIRGSEPNGNVGIGHTRWSTHGAPTDDNAHPHTDESGRVAVVHNGVIENYEELKASLEAEGVEFVSDTDTEVVPHLIASHLAEVGTPEEAFRRAVQELDGSYAIAAIVDGFEAVYAARQGSPLVLGLDDGEYFLASDVPAFLEHTAEVVYLEDGDMVVVEPDSVSMTTVAGEPVSRDIDTVDWDPEDAGKGSYDHYMLKEIHNQPTSLANTVEGRIEDDGVSLTELDTFDGVTDVQFVACGTSYHAALYGARLLNAAGVRARAFRASEYGTADPITDETLVVAVTQSGETADTLGALERAEAEGARTVAVTNVQGSTVSREADETLLVRAGPEIGVAATKTFSSQVAALCLLGHRIGEDVTGDLPWDDPTTFFESLRSLPENVREVLDGDRAHELADRYLGSEAFFFIGRGLGYSVAVEGALKFKEITYEHAEGFASGELKHGPLALVTPQTPVFAVFTGTDDQKTLTNAKEAQTRGAPIVAVAPEGHPAVDAADAHLPIPDTDPALAGLLANVQLQLVSYHTANLLGRSIDKPRNLAKSVTVE
ncbi:glutamine--fructose-6-phosphate aminotransferase [Haloprofundus marisrubri]|uniref:Glutamine--fructose-6-phosphate aminotransferase [isomerizing] n=1 Tax=Haloprofundus marisrubri TaxID=1514971 RepID=A0A0W1R4N3_9EURY|nr:glutamine--fructose-6-phosphate transaminase (isomerizing) [Haloprofundus marisrubri]KTG08389.1 glutamine--fructose-6-phosphate aminotransferase [Haloprofundus marisrubri]